MVNDDAIGSGGTRLDERALNCEPRSVRLGAEDCRKLDSSVTGRTRLSFDSLLLPSKVVSKLFLIAGTLSVASVGFAVSAALDPSGTEGGKGPSWSLMLRLTPLEALFRDLKSIQRLE